MKLFTGASADRPDAHVGPYSIGLNCYKTRLSRMKTMLLASNAAGGLYEFWQELLETLTNDNKVLLLTRRLDILNLIRIRSQMLCGEAAR